MRIDHVAFGWDDLDPVRRSLDRVGLPADEGGTHADGTTRMALTGFPDGSYLEWVAPTPGTDPAAAGLWPDALAARAGPVAWCLGTDDVVAAAKRALDRGLPVDGPHRGGRDRPDGRRVEWDQFLQGSDATRWFYPFVIDDRTPREWRVTPTDGVTALAGVDTVVLAVSDLDRAARRLERRYRTATPVAVDTDAVPGEAVDLPGAPVALARGEASRIDRLGERPAAVLLGTDDFGAARAAYDLAPALAWGDRRVAWFDDDRLRGRVGVVNGTTSEG
jgi:hypothetical protein